MNPSKKSTSSGITIVIPAVAPFDLLEALLGSIDKAHKADRFDCEVIVVWDGPENPTATIKQFENRTHIVARCLYVEAGPAMKRNVGIAAARNTIVICVDSDCTIHPNLLNRVSSAFADPNVQAMAVPVNFEAPRNAWERATSVMPFRQAFTWAMRGSDLWWVPGATIALRKSTVEKLGGFWSIGCGPDHAEDVDLGLRWTNALGCPAVKTDPSSPSSHARQTWANVFKTVRRTWRFGTSEGYLWGRHPSFRRRNLPPFLMISLLGIIVWVISIISSTPFNPALAIGGVLLLGWCLIQILILHKQGLHGLSLLLGLLLITVFETARTLSLWKVARTLTGALWFHEMQPVGSWKMAVLSGWYLMVIALFFWLFTLMSGITR